MAPRAAGAAAGLPAAPLGPTPAGAGCPPQAAAWPRRPEPIVFRAAGAAILKLFSGLSEEGGTPAGDLGVTAEEQGRRPIRTGRAAARGAGAGGRRRRGAPGRSLKEPPSGAGLGLGTGEGDGRNRAERRPRGQALPGPRRRAGRRPRAFPKLLRELRSGHAFPVSAVFFDPIAYVQPFNWSKCHEGAGKGFLSRHSASLGPSISTFISKFE